MVERFEFGPSPDEVSAEESKRAEKIRAAQTALFEVGRYLEIDEIIDPELREKLVGDKIIQIKTEFSNLVEALGAGLNSDPEPKQQLEYIEALETLGYIDPVEVEQILKGVMIYPETLSRIKTQAQEKTKQWITPSRIIKKIFNKQ